MPVDKILADFGEKMVNDVRKELKDNHVVFGGGQESKLGATAEYKIRQKANGVEFVFLMRKEWYWVNGGRKPGKVSKEGRGLIADWLRRKAIIGKFQTKELAERQAKQNASKSKPENKNRSFKKLKKLPFDKATKALTFLKSRGITIHGYKANHFFDKVHNDGRKVVLQSTLKAETKKDLILEFKIK